MGVGGAGLGAGLAGAAALGVAGSMIYSAVKPTPSMGGGSSGYSSSMQTSESLIAQSNEKAEEDRKELLRQRSARTILTGPRGVFEEADTAKKTLLGG
jgi:hypothetical protein